MGRFRGRGVAYRARIAVLIGAAVLAIALAMLEALAGQSGPTALPRSHEVTGR